MHTEFQGKPQVQYVHAAQEISCHISVGTELFLVPSPVGERKSEPAAAGVLAWACVCLGLSLALCGKCLVELWEGIRALAGRPAHDSTGALSGAALCQEPSA